MCIDVGGIIVLVPTAFLLRKPTVIQHRKKRFFFVLKIKYIFIFLCFLKLLKILLS